MFKKFLFIIIAIVIIGVSRVEGFGSALPLVSPIASEQNKLLGHRKMSLENRYAVPSVNEVFKDNILLNIAYQSGKVTKASDIKWDEVRQDFTYEFTLQPGEVFAYHEDVLPEYAGKKVVTTNAHFNAADGFLTDGYLYGDGVCHYASLLYWAAKDAGLAAKAPVNHSFAVIPEVPAEYGVSIYSNPGAVAANAQQNLYIENSFDVPVKFVIEYKEGFLNIFVYEEFK